MDHEEQFDDIRVVSIDAGTDEGADITIEYNTKRITVSIFASSTQDNAHTGTSVEDELIRLLNQAVDAADEDYEDLMNNALDRVLDLAGATFSDVAPRICASQQASTVLHAHLYPDTFDFRLQTIDRKVSISQISPDEMLCVPDTAPDPHFHTDFEPDDHLPFFSSDEIYILESFGSGNGTVSKVQVGSMDMLCKARRVGLGDIGLEQELKRLQMIRKAA
ncbi:hypothetical protein VFPPC_13533 [Pochonia chlamydosporia 170]|uniref:Uncharacterized protein n=1 Tax=Pochonia chlamydosporia 170 TaxID=1380566 RepID=A0A179F2F7_METCM|nr:hypothetical protein VFPPC_13533 [Pochonia chlamydosporia 170]OAQ59608.1 hypothetical protein VFPPC_13533 [Pochonia chlamydosporia 170]